MPLTVGLDYLPAVCHPPGVGRYARELVRALVRLEDAPRLALFEVGGGERVMEGAPLGLDAARTRVRRVRSRAPRRAVDWWHRLTGLGADSLLGGVDLFHRVRPDHPPAGGAPEVLAVAELPLPGSAAESVLARAAARAAAVVVFSEHYRTAVPERLGVPAERVHHTPVGCEHWAREVSAPPPRAVPPRILALGALRAARHPAAVLAGFEELRAGGIDAELCFVGGPGDAADALRRALERSPCRDRVRWLSDVRERDMPELAGASSALVHLADDEGSPVTPLEAFGLGVAVVASRIPAFVEVLGGEAETVDTGAVVADPALLAEALARALEHPDRPEREAARRAIAARFPWEASARKTVEVWQHIRPR